MEKSIINWISGPVVKVSQAGKLHLNEMVEVGPEKLIGEVIELEENTATIQVYEDTTGLKPGMPVSSKGLPLYVELGPGLIGTIFDGLQRPLTSLETLWGTFLQRGKGALALDREKIWHFKPQIKIGDIVKGGEIIGVVPETHILNRYILVPPDVSGKVIDVVPSGDYTIEDIIATIQSDKNNSRKELKLYHRWPIRTPRPYKNKITPQEPLITGQRVIDIFFPLAKGGTAAIPGGFGTGKTITQHQLSKWADADIIIYIGCGERGNEMTGVLVDFPKLLDPRTKRPLIERTVLIANTSNMPVAAREASIYTGITIAEYFRDMGYHVAVMADSTSRWAEALREISGRLEEMPAEEGFPAYLAKRLAEFYERSGYVINLNGNRGSVSVIGAVSPPGGDFSEPVTSHTKRFVRCFWALDKELASARYFPAINYMESYSEYKENVQNWWLKKDKDWEELRKKTIAILHEDHKLQNIVKLIGEQALPDEQKLIIEMARIIKDDFLQQSAFDPIDTYALPEKQMGMLKVIIHFYERAEEVMKRHIPLYKLKELSVINEIHRMKSKYTGEDVSVFENIKNEIDKEIHQLLKESGFGS